MLRLVTLAVILSASLVVGQQQGLGPIPSSCTAVYTSRDGTNYTYDLTNLILPPGQQYTAVDEFGFNYWFNVCANVTCVPQAGVCQSVLKSQQPGHNVGYYTATQSYWDVIDRFNGSRGLKFTIGGGDGCAGGVTRTATLFFDCVPNGGLIAGNITVDEANCAYDIHVPSGYGCPTIPTPTPTPTPQPGGGGHGLSGGSIFLIIFFVVGFCYVAGGCVFRRVSYGVSGTEACPNHEFWGSLPGLVGDGSKFCWANTVGRVTGGGGGAYEGMK